MCKTSDSLMNQAFGLRITFNEIDDNISGYITWQDTPEGRATNLPRIDESHKDILFIDWGIQLKQVERAVSKAADAANNIIEFKLSA